MGRQAFEVPLHEDGPALWPAVVPLAMLETAHRDLGTPRYRTIYNGEKGGLVGRYIAREWFMYGTAPADSLCYMTIDPAISKRTEADETAIVVGNVSTEPMLYTRWVWHGRKTSLETVEIIARAWQHYRPVVVAIEAVAYQSALVEIAQEKYPELPLQKWTPQGDKTLRHMSLAACYEFGRITHHPSLRGTAFEYQLVRLPGAKHDDMADAAYMLADLAGIASGAHVTGPRPEGMR